MKLDITPLNATTALVSFQLETLDAGNVNEFREAISPAIDGSDLLLLDMQGLAFIDSSGLGALLSCLRRMHAKNGKLALFGLNRPVIALLELVRMHRLFSIYASRTEALDELVPE